MTSSLSFSLKIRYFVLKPSTRWNYCSMVGLKPGIVLVIKKISSALPSRDDDYDDHNAGSGGDDDGDDAQFRSSVSAELKQDLSFEFMNQQEIHCTDW